MNIPKIESLLLSHPLHTSLLSSTDDVKLHQGVLEIPPELRGDHFVVGTLATTAGFSVTPVTAVSVARKTVLAIFYLGPGLSAATGGLVHGGAVATMMDEACARAGVVHLEGMIREKAAAAKKKKQNGGEKAAASSSKGKSGSSPTGAVTSNLNLKFLAPVRTNSCVIVEAKVQPGASEKQAKVTARMWNLAEKEGEEDVLSAEAESKFVRAAKL